VVSVLNGCVSSERISKDLNRLVSHGKYVTTLYDFYGFRGLKRKDNKNTLETKILKTVDKSRQKQIIPYVQMHEFEGLLFSSPYHLVKETDSVDKIMWIEAILKKYRNNPEMINNSIHTAPSKRLRYLSYSKTTHGAEIAKRIGVSKLKQMCTGFRVWLTTLENLK